MTQKLIQSVNSLFKRIIHLKYYLNYFELQNISHDADFKIAYICNNTEGRQKPRGKTCGMIFGVPF